MKILDFFMSPKARERAYRRERRHAFRQAEKAIDDVKERQKELEKEASKQWAAARDALKNGEKAAAQRALTSYRASQVLVMKLEQKRWVFEQYYTKMQVAQSDGTFVSAMDSLTKVIEIDPEKVADVFESAQGALGEQVESDKFWDKMYAKEMNGASGQLEDHIPSLDEMTAQLDQEVAVEVGNGAPEMAGQALDARISQGQERIKNMLEGK